MVRDPGRHEKVPDRIPEGPDLEVDFDTLEERTVIGSGGTAEVVEATVRGTGTVLAVKRPRLENTLEADVAERFATEAETWAKLDDHENVVGVVDRGTEPIPWIALEYMDGGSLRDRIGDCSLEQGLWIGMQAAAGIRAAHRRGVAHLDLKPDNVLFRVTDEGRWDAPKVSDWGLAKVLLDRSQPMDGLSPTYAAPEQLDADEYGSADDLTDVYQLGTIVYEMVTGSPPFSGSATTVVNGHLTDAPPKPTDVDPSLPHAVDDVLGTALEKRKADRYQSVLDFRRDLTSVFAHVAFGDDADLIAEGDVWTTGGVGDARSRTGNGDRGSRHTAGDHRDGSTSASSAGVTGSGRAASDSATDTDDDTSHRLRKGSTFGGSDDSRILQRLTDESTRKHEREFPWQYRDDPPGLEREGTRESDRASRDDERPESTNSSGTDEDAQSDGSALDSGGLVVWWVVGGVVALVGLGGDVPFLTLFGVALVAVSTWKGGLG